MSPQEANKFEDIARGRQAQMQSEESEEAQEYEHGQQEQVFDWDLSSAAHIPKPNLVDTSKYTQSLKSEVSAWTSHMAFCCLPQNWSVETALQTPSLPPALKWERPSS